MVSRRELLFGSALGTAALLAGRQAGAFSTEEIAPASGLGLALSNRCGGAGEHAQLVSNLQSQLAASGARSGHRDGHLPICGCPVTATAPGLPGRPASPRGTGPGDRSAVALSRPGPAPFGETDPLQTDAMDSWGTSVGPPRSCARSLQRNASGRLSTARGRTRGRGRPECLVLDLKATALVVVDLQNGVAGAAADALIDGARVVARSVELGHAVAGAGGTIALVNVSYADDYADPPEPADGRAHEPARRGLPGDWATLAPEVSALPARVRITKRQQSAFYGTELDLQLRRRGISTVLLCGIADQLRGRGDRAATPITTTTPW